MGLPKEIEAVRSAAKLGLPPLEARIESLEAELFVQRLPYAVAKKPTQDRDEMFRRSRSLAN